MKLAIADYHLGREPAGSYVLELCKSLKIKIHKSDLKHKINVNGIVIDLASEVEFVRKNGKANILQSILDSQDRFLNSPISMGVVGSNISISSSYGQHTTTIKSAGYIEAPETSFSDELLFYRKEAVKAFNSGDLADFCRCYRAFLQSSVSLVECFIHRYNFHIKILIPDAAEYSNTETLDSRRSIDERLEAWVTTFACHKMEDFKRSKQRSKFIELKDQRNHIVHPANPTISYDIKGAVKYLNYVREGVGGLLCELRKYSGHSEHIGFMSHIKTAPEIRIPRNS